MDISAENTHCKRGAQFPSPASVASAEKPHTGTLTDRVYSVETASGKQVKGGRGHGCLTVTVHNRLVKSMNRNLTRTTGHGDDSLTALHHVQEEVGALEEDLDNMGKDTNAKTFVTFKKEIVDRQYKTTNANQIERNKAVEICSEGKRRTLILSPVSVIQTAAKLNSTVEGDRGVQLPLPASVMLTSATSVDRTSDDISDSKRRTENLSPVSVQRHFQKANRWAWSLR